MRSIGTKITCIVGAAMLLVSVLVIISVYSIYRHHMEAMMEDTSELALRFDLAIREYVGAEVRSRMFHLLPDDAFVPETMSTTFVARSVFEMVQESFPDYILKFSSEDPRNPANMAGPDEAEVLRYFREHPEEEEWSGKIEVGGKEYWGRFRARRVKPSCLLCHGDPGDAPAALVERYGDEGGFHLAVGDVAGMDMVAVPMATIHAGVLAESKDHLLALAVILAVGLAGIVIALRIIVVNRLSSISRRLVAATEYGDYARLEPL